MLEIQRWLFYSIVEKGELLERVERENAKSGKWSTYFVMGLPVVRGDRNM
jgi:hypothetical protein